MAKGKRSTAALVGSWAFLLGALAAVVLGLGYLGAYRVTLLWVVFLLGLVVGLLNVTHNETNAFLTSGTVLALVSYLGVQAGVFESQLPQLFGILNGLLTLFVPATIVVALRAVWGLAKTE